MRGRSSWIAIALVLIVLVYIGIDLWGPRHSSLRNFDPSAVAQLESDMWRANYDRREGRVFRGTVDLLRTQYHLPPLRANVVAYDAARAAFVFKRGRARAEYETALPSLVRYYEAIRAVGDTSFDPTRAANLELEWWIVHRQREEHPPEDLVNALAALQAELYSKPASAFQEHARLRAEAMTIRDTRAAAGGVSRDDWHLISSLLRDSWTDLSRVVKE